MRPIEKWDCGEHVLADGSTVNIKDTYNHWRDAKPLLVHNFGCVCSYCEKAYAEVRDLDVEHIQPKGFKDAAGNLKYDHLMYKWSNFLLACKTCNGADNKDTKDVIYGQCHLPHLNNTFLSLVYKTGGVVAINSNLEGDSFRNAEALLKLVGLNKTPKTSKPGDTRWKTRFETWRKAERYRTKYNNRETDIETIIDLAKAQGGWSIWFTVFKGCDEVRKALIDEFAGTCKDCFDSNNHYEPVRRNPQNETDPV